MRKTRVDSDELGMVLNLILHGQYWDEKVITDIIAYVDGKPRDAEYTCALVDLLDGKDLGSKFQVLSGLAHGMMLGEV